MARLVSELDIQQFAMDGAVCLRQVFSQRWVEEVRRGIELNKANPSAHSESLKGDASEGAYFNDYCNWENIAPFKNYIEQSPAAEIAGWLMESKVSAIYHEHVLTKEPGTLKRTPWHHDQSYYPIDGTKVCSIWMPVDPVPIETAIQFVRGSHLWSEWFYPRKFATGRRYPINKSLETSEDASEEAPQPLSSGSETTENPALSSETTEDPALSSENPEDLPPHPLSDEVLQQAPKKKRIYQDVPEEEIEDGQHEILSWAVEPGDCIVFHMKTVHGAPGNESVTTHRRVLSTRWFGDDAVIAERPWPVSPPLLAPLNPGDRAVENFPVIWRLDEQPEVSLKTGSVAAAIREARNFHL